MLPNVAKRCQMLPSFAKFRQVLLIVANCCRLLPSVEKSELKSFNCLCVCGQNFIPNLSVKLADAVLTDKIVILSELKIQGNWELMYEGLDQTSNLARLELNWAGHS